MIELKKAKKVQLKIFSNGDVINCLMNIKNKKAIKFIAKKYDIVNNDCIIRLFNTEYVNGDEATRKHIEYLDSIIFE